ncbi:hypothetical protein DFH06DRAFT_1149573 [Mycena polygramma]|nr:hypothetical protein DFH06DRAFT_1149573 [Mycena polygramma]
MTAHGGWLCSARAGDAVGAPPENSRTSPPSGSPAECGARERRGREIAHLNKGAALQRERGRPAAGDAVGPREGGADTDAGASAEFPSACYAHCRPYPAHPAHSAHPDRPLHGQTRDVRLLYAPAAFLRNIFCSLSATTPRAFDGRVPNADIAITTPTTGSSSCGIACTPWGLEKGESVIHRIFPLMRGIWWNWVRDMRSGDQRMKKKQEAKAWYSHLATHHASAPTRLAGTMNVSGKGEESAAYGFSATSASQSHATSWALCGCRGLEARGTKASGMVARSGSEIGSNLNRTELNARFRFKAYREWSSRYIGVFVAKWRRKLQTNVCAFDPGHAKKGKQRVVKTWHPP